MRLRILSSLKPISKGFKFHVPLHHAVNRDSPFQFHSTWLRGGEIKVNNLWAFMVSPSEGSSFYGIHSHCSQNHQCLMLNCVHLIRCSCNVLGSHPGSLKINSSENAGSTPSQSLLVPRLSTLMLVRIYTSNLQLQDQNGGICTRS
jgi:hypothetical protein